MNLYIAKELPTFYYENGNLPMDWDIGGYKMFLIAYRYDTSDEKLKGVDMSEVLEDLKKHIVNLLIK